MDSSNCLSYKRLVILHKLRCANCVTKILCFFHTTKLSVPVFSNFIFFTRIVTVFLFTRNIADSHGFSFFLFLSRIIETCPWTHWPQGGNYRIIEFYVFVPRLVLGPELSNFCLPWFSVILRVIEKKYFGTRKIIPWYSAILRVIKDNSIIL